MQRNIHWPKLLEEYLESRKDSEFQFGSFDCCLFTCDAVQAMTGVDMAEDLRGYKTPAEVVRITREYDYKISNIADNFAKKFNLQKIENINFAQKGDVALVLQHNDIELLGVIIQGGRVACAGNKGLVFLPIDSAVCAWRVPY